MRTINAMHTMHQPNIQITPAAAHGMKAQEKSTTVISRNTNHRPRVRKNCDSCGIDFPRAVARKAPVPARKQKTGAQ